MYLSTSLDTSVSLASEDLPPFHTRTVMLSESGRRSVWGRACLEQILRRRCSTPDPAAHYSLFSRSLRSVQWARPAHELIRDRL